MQFSVPVAFAKSVEKLCKSWYGVSFSLVREWIDVNRAECLECWYTVCRSVCWYIYWWIFRLAIFSINVLVESREANMLQQSYILTITRQGFETRRASVNQRHTKHSALNSICLMQEEPWYEPSDELVYPTEWHGDSGFYYSWETQLTKMDL